MRVRAYREDIGANDVVDINFYRGGYDIACGQTVKERGNTMKFKTTQKAIKQGYKNVIIVSYCGLQSLLRRENPIAYTTRTEGWGADIYGFGNAAIVTGYAPFGNIRPSYETNQKYESKARKTIEQYPSYEIQKRQLSLLIVEYIEEVTQ